MRPDELTGGCLLLSGVGIIAALLFSWAIALIQAHWWFLVTIVGIVWGIRFWRQYEQQRRSQRLFLQQTFYRLLQEHQGRLTVFDFAVKTNLSGAEARAYLNARAKEFYANFESSDRGDILYVFPMLQTMPLNTIDAERDRSDEQPPFS